MALAGMRPRRSVELLGSPAPLPWLEWVQAIGFPAAFAGVLLWALLWQLPRMADRITDALASERLLLSEIRHDIRQLLDRTR
jgi:hypothetical protein